MTTQLEVQQKHFGLQAHFMSPVFDLFKDLPALGRHLFSILAPHYNLRLTDIKFEASGGNLGEVHLRLSWPALAEARLFLDRVEVNSAYLQFLRFRERDLVADVLSAVNQYSKETGFRAHSVTQHVHGALVGESRFDFLSRFCSNELEGFGPALGSGVVFYFGELAERLATSVTIDFSRVVDGGIFLQSIVLYDASRVATHDLQEISRSDFASLMTRLGLAE